MSLIKVGEQAPDFKFVDTDDNEVKLSDFKGKKSYFLSTHLHLQPSVLTKCVL